MKLLKGQVHGDFHKDVFWQRSHIKNEGGYLLCKIIICASAEALSAELERNIAKIKLEDADLQDWFTKKTEEEFNKFIKSDNSKTTEMMTIIDITPQIESLFDFVHTL